MSSISVHMYMVLWLNAWFAEHACEKHLLLFDGKCRFRKFLDKFIKDISGGKVLLSHKPKTLTATTYILLNEKGIFI